MGFRDEILSLGFLSIVEHHMGKTMEHKVEIGLSLIQGPAA